MSTIHANPLQAANERAEPTRRNFAKVIKNEITDMPLQLKERSGIPANVYTPFWVIVYEALDAEWSDGTPLTGENYFSLQFGSKLYNSDGEPLDKEQRPYVNSLAFAGLGITVFPDDPEYEDIVGDCFLIEMTEFPTGRAQPIPIEYLGRDFVFDGEKRVVQTREERAAASNGVAASPQSTSVELSEDKTALTSVMSALEGVDFSDRGAVLSKLQTIGPGKTINGSSLLGLAASGKLEAALVELIG